MADTTVDFLLELLRQLLVCGKIVSRLSLVQHDQIKFLYEELGFLRKFLKDTEGKRHEHEEVKILVAWIGDVAYELEDKFDSFFVRFLHMPEPRMHQKKEEDKYAKIVKNLMLDHVINEIKSIQKEVKKIYDEGLYGIGVPQVGMSSRGSSSRISAPKVDEETVIGFDDDADMIKQRLIDDIQTQLEVISIVGMPGIGKTTLARKIYNDPFIVYHFYVRGWTYVSQVPRKRDLLLGILISIVEHIGEIYTFSDEKLGEELYRSLSSKRYLIVMDDIWHIQAWIDLKKYFPNNNNGSRIVFTSRITDMALHAKLDSSPHFLNFLTLDESWDLLQQKVFGKESCPPDFVEIGKQIAVKCRGLPLAIVVIAGLLAKTGMTQDWWKQVAESVSSYILSDTEQCMDTLALSYNHLPHHLKSCFLYFGAFPEDYEISVRKLIWLWIAEGFIQQTKNKNLEDLAEEYLMDLIDRNLVLVAKNRSTGGIRSCRVHDLLRDLCLKKAEEDNFLQHIYVHGESGSILIVKKQRRLCIHVGISYSIYLEPFVPPIRSLLCFASEEVPSSPYHTLIYHVFELLRVLDLSAISMNTNFPNELLQLLLLRYLAIQGKNLIIPSSISNLRILETLIFSHGKGTKGTIIPTNIWKMVKLRHLYIAGENDIKPLSPYSEGNYPLLVNLQTISQVCPSTSCLDVLRRTPNLRKLGLCGNFTSGRGILWFPNLSFLNNLETLKLLNRAPYVEGLNNNDGCNRVDRSIFRDVEFPPNIKRLTLSRTFQKWREISILGMLPNLEVLKLEFQACVGPLWKTREGGFRKLRFLRFYYMYFEQWDTSSTHFPSLQRLVLHRCEKLKEIPSELVDISTLHTIEVTCCSHSAVNSARQIQEEQQSMGNDWLKILIYPLNQEHMNSSNDDCY